MSNTSYPISRFTLLMFAALLLAMVIAMAALFSVDDPVRLKALIEDAGPVQMVGQVSIFLAFGLGCLYAIVDRARRATYIQLSYLLMFYALREADYHYRVSEHAKATQFKRFFSHEMIPLSTKLFLAAIVVLFLVVLYRYLRNQKPFFIAALKSGHPWALCALAWGGCSFYHRP